MIVGVRNGESCHEHVEFNRGYGVTLISCEEIVGHTTEVCTIVLRSFPGDAHLSGAL